MNTRDAGIATVGLVVMLFAGTALVIRPAPATWPSAVAREGPFVDAIVETGTITAQHMRMYGSDMSGAPAKIVEIAAEGQAVRAGDLLLRFDTGRLQQGLEAERASLGQAEAELVRAQQEARLEVLRGKVEMDGAEQQLANAERSLANQVEGHGQVTVLEAETALSEAARELARARTTVGDLRPLLAERFITRTELERAEQALRHAEDQSRLAQARRDSLATYEAPAATAKAQSEVGAARDAIIGQRQNVAARVTTRYAVERAAASRIDEIRARIGQFIDQIARATVRAESPGLVTYHDLSFGSDRRKPQIGDEVYSNQPIIALPDSSQLIVETHVREIDLHKVNARQRVQVRVDAYPDLRLTGSVVMIGALAQTDSTLAGTKLFPVIVALATSDERLRTGMTARVEIEVARFPWAVVVPVQAVFDDNSTRYVVMVRGGRPERRPVTLAAESESLAALAPGGDAVKAGDAVLLVDPTTPAAR
jgi:HlyD family secretion protein